MPAAATALSSSAPSAGGVNPSALGPSSQAELDAKLRRLRGEARRFATLPPLEKARLLRTSLQRFLELAPRMVEEGRRAKGIEDGSEAEGEEWFSGPVVSIRAIRLFAEALEDIARRGKPHIDPSYIEPLPNGKTSVRAAPRNNYERALYPGWVSDIWLSFQKPSEIGESQARFYRDDPGEGAVTLVLGAGNVGSISVLDVLHHSFGLGAVCLLKMSPVNAYLGPLYELAFEPLVKRGFLAFAYGGPEVGEYLTHHPAVDRIHVTGSIDTHDSIVFGPRGPERDERKRTGQPLLQKPVTSELGNISPILIVPALYSDRELDRVAWKIAGQVVQNASFNCLAGKLIITPKGFKQREALLERVAHHLTEAPTRVAYYPGARARYDALLGSASDLDVRRYGDGTQGKLPWTLVRGVPEDSRSPFFEVEPFCALISETCVGSSDPVEFLAAATEFANQKLWGTLSATIMIPRGAEQDSSIARALDGAVRGLRYGTVGVNLWPAVGYGIGSAPWGGYPGSTLSDAQSGIGWGHNTLMLEGIEKSVVRASLLGLKEFVWYPGHRRLAALGRAIARAEAGPSPRAVLGAAFALIRR